MGKDFLTIGVGPHLLCVPAGSVREVLGAVALQPLAGAPRGIIGCVLVRGLCVPVFDLGWLLGLGVRALDPTQRLVVVTTQRGPLALRADTLEGLERGAPLGGPAHDALPAVFQGVRGLVRGPAQGLRSVAAADELFEDADWRRLEAATASWRPD